MNLSPDPDQSQDQLIGYLVGKVEEIDKKMDLQNEDTKIVKRDLETWRKDMDDRMNRIEQKVVVAKVLFALGKVAVAITFAIVSLKLGNIDKAFSTFWQSLTG